MLLEKKVKPRPWSIIMIIITFRYYHYRQSVKLVVLTQNTNIIYTHYKWDLISSHFYMTLQVNLHHIATINSIFVDAISSLIKHNSSSSTWSRGELINISHRKWELSNSIIVIIIIILASTILSRLTQRSRESFYNFFFVAVLPLSKLKLIWTKPHSMPIRDRIIRFSWRTLVLFCFHIDFTSVL